MMYYEFNHSKIKKGKKLKIFCPYDKKELERQLSEIFQDEHYKAGLRKKDMIVIDCGANIGMASIYFAPYAKIIYALEPNHEYYSCLVENTKDYPNIKTFNQAMGIFNGTDILISMENDPRAESFYGNGTIQEKVECVTFDKFLEDNKLDHVDLLKIDTEGAEYPLFCSEGFRKVAPKIDFIVGESHYVGHFIPDFIPLMLKDAGFEAKFEDILNMFKTASYFDPNLKKDKIYKIELKTIFSAERRQK